MKILVLIALILVGLSLWVGLNLKRLLRLHREVILQREKLCELLAGRHDLISRFADSFAPELAKLPDLAEKLQGANRAATNLCDKQLAERVFAENELSDSIGLLLQPLQKELVASEEYVRLRDEILTTDDALNLTSQSHNQLAARLNYMQQLLPVKLLVAKFGITPVSELAMQDSFSRHPLQLTATRPAPRRTDVQRGTNPTEAV